MPPSPGRGRQAGEYLVLQPSRAILGLGTNRPWEHQLAREPRGQRRDSTQAFPRNQESASWGWQGKGVEWDLKVGAEKPSGSVESRAPQMLAYLAQVGEAFLQHLL